MSSARRPAAVRSLSEPYSAASSTCVRAAVTRNATSSSASSPLTTSFPAMSAPLGWAPCATNYHSPPTFGQIQVTYRWISSLACRMVPTMARLNGKVAAVTGGASGIGEATVRRFVMEGAKVAFADRDADRGKRVAEEIAASGGAVAFVEAHVEREVEAAAFVRQAAQRFGRLDILVNNAGVRLYHTVEEASAESWDEILGVNLKGYAFCAKAAMPFLRQATPGSIVNVASVRSVTSIGKTTQYDTTKAAVAGLTRGMAADHAADGIRVNAVCPGPIYTPFHEKRNEAIGRTFEQYRDDAAKGTLLRRHGTPDEVAACILFLASDDASYVTGTLLFVDGGYTAM